MIWWFVTSKVGRSLVIKRLQRLLSVCFAHRDNYMRNAHSSTETDKCIWFSGHSNITVVALQDLSMLNLSNFLPDGGDYNRPVPIKAAMADSCETIVVFYLIAQIECLAYLSNARKEPTNYILEDFLPKSSHR